MRRGKHAVPPSLIGQRQFRIVFTSLRSPESGWHRRSHLCAICYRTASSVNVLPSTTPEVAVYSAGGETFRDGACRPTFPGYRSCWSRSSVLEVPRQRNSIAADSLTAKTARCSAPLGRNSLFYVDQAYLCRRRLSHLTSSPGHAGAGGARSWAIYIGVSWNLCRGTVTSAIWAR